VNYGRAEREWGFTMLTPHQNGTDWAATFITFKGRAKFACKIRRAQATCGRKAIVAH